MPRKMRNSGHSGPPDRPGTSGFARQSGGELFRRKRVRDLTGHNGGTPRRSLKGVNPLHGDALTGRELLEFPDRPALKLLLQVDLADVLGFVLQVFQHGVPAVDVTVGFHGSISGI